METMTHEYPILSEQGQGSLQRLFERVKDERNRMHDIVMPANALRMLDDGSICINQVPMKDQAMMEEFLGSLGIAVSNEDAEAMALDLPYNAYPLFHQQLAAKLGIPKRYYDRMDGDDVGLRAENVNYWLQHAKEDRNFLVRTLRPKDGEGPGMLRALLSDKYLILNNYDVVLTALKTMKDMGIRVDVLRADLSETNMYLSFQAPDVKIDATPMLRNYVNPRTGDRRRDLTAGFTLRNSEVGAGRFEVVPRPFANCCLNAFTLKQDRLSRVHLGGNLEEGAIEYSEKTRVLNFELVNSQVADAVKTFLTTEYLESLQAKVLDKAGRKLEHPVNAVKNAASFLKMNEEEADQLLEYFIQGKEESGVGLLNAVTFQAQTFGDPERMYAMEESMSDLLANMRAFDRADN